ncbi:MAG: PA0069 family radical SAM protein [Anaeromyxobacter sp.]
MHRRPASNPPNRFLSERVDFDEPQTAGVVLRDDATREILSHNDSPDIGFSWSVNPYRGCQHACAYCYARPTHEYLGLGAGTDFDTQLFVKRRAPELLRAAFERPSWKGETLAFSGVTDPWQPVEAELRLTRALLEVCLEYRNPVGVISKSALLGRDLDVLTALKREARVSVSVTIPFLDPSLARALEPWAPAPATRLELVARLAEAGLEPSVVVAPVIPGLDHELPRVLEAAREAGAARAGWILLRLPGAVAPVFEERLRAALPDAAPRILHLVRETRGGKLYDARYGRRGRGEGPYAATVAAVFAKAAARLGLAGQGPMAGLSADPAGCEAEPTTTFRRPPRHGQLALFDR